MFNAPSPMPDDGTASVHLFYAPYCNADYMEVYLADRYLHLSKRCKHDFRCFICFPVLYLCLACTYTVMLLRYAVNSWDMLCSAYAKS